jgi:hypothetical protein
LEFVVPDPRGPLHFFPSVFVTSYGYFRPNGFQSLKREDFKSSEAKGMPIMHDKNLLNAENGKGTNVLFGYGHVEWLTAEELHRLQTTQRP